MKKIGSICAIAALVVAACKPEIKPIGEAYKAGEGIIGQWELVDINVIDITLPVPETRDQSAILKDEASRLRVTINDNGTYTIDQRGIVPDIFGTEGTWMYDKEDFPTELYLLPTTGDTVKTELLSMPRTTDNQFGFSYTRTRCDKDYATLEYTFNRK